ncbi:MAG: hypothetical protein U0797_11150 [Gemmataceae bacterium]
MASDMLVALRRSTEDGHTYFGHNATRPRGEALSVVRAAAREFAPGESIQLPRTCMPQARHTFTVLAGRTRDEWGYQYGVNEKGVAVGCTPIRTRLDDPCGLTGPEVVRLVLERGATGCQAVETLIDLIGRHGVEAHAFLVVDPEGAEVLEAGGHHWVLAEVGSVRAVTGVCLLRQDWDRIAPGLSGIAIDRRWWPADGQKLDFAHACGAAGPDHAQDLRRWGQATLALEHQSGHLDAPLLRRVLTQQAALVGQTSRAGGEEVETAASGLIRLSPNRDEPPVLWYAPCSPVGSVYLPLLLDADPPTGSMQALRPALLAHRAGEGRADLQQRLDDHLHEYLPEASGHQGRASEPESARGLVHAVRRRSGRRGRPRAGAGAGAGPGVVSPPVTYEVGCPCGQKLQGERQARHQVVTCPGCRRGVFVLPRSPFATPPSQGAVTAQPALLWRSWRAPLAAAAVCLAVVLSAFHLAWPYLMREDKLGPLKTDNAPPGKPPTTIEEGRRALAQGRFRVARQMLDEVPGQGRELARLRRQAALLASLSPRSLEEIVRHAKLVRDPDEWARQFDDYRDRSVLFDDAVRRDAAGEPVLANYVVEAGDAPVRVALGDLLVLRDLPLDDAPRLIFGARLAGCGREEGGGWVVRFDPDSGVLLTELAAVEACYPAPLDPGVKPTLERQARWLDERASPAAPPKEK